MSLTQTYFLAHKARAKLSTEAARADHDLRLLVGHANLLDSLMLELADAEREQESWFNQSVRGASRQAQEESQLKTERHIQWADAIAENPEDEEAVESASESDSESESDSDEYESDDDIDVEMHDAASLRRLPAQLAQSTISYHYNHKPLLSVEEDEVEEEEEEYDMEEDDLEEDYAQLQLVRTHSHSNSPPELVEHEPHDLDSSDDEDQESMPPSPPDAILSFSEKDSKEQIRQQQEQQSPQDHHGSFYSDGFYLPRRGPSRLVSAISVY